VTDGELFRTPEEVAGAGPGETLEVSYAADGRWAVVVHRRRGALEFVLCAAAEGGWRFEDEGEMVATPGSVQSSTWISLVDGLHAPNTGVEITIGRPDETFWLIRWNVPEPE